MLDIKNLVKVTAKQYAQGLYEATKEKSREEIDVVLKRFVKILSENDQIKKKKDIIAKFSQIYNQKNKIVQAQVTSREKLQEDVLAQVRVYVKNKYEAKEVILAEKIDEKIQGGIVLKVGDEVMDASISRKMSELKRILKK